MTRRIVTVLLRGGLLVLLIAFGMPGAAVADPVSAQSNPTVESAYAQPGPWAVTSRAGFACCDSAGSNYDVWYPADLGANGFRHPIVSWGDGTWAHPGQYDYLLRHLASWGFVVVATENSSTGSGVDITDAVDKLLDVAADPASVFHDRLDPNAIGAMGHSQGATGVLNAMRDSGGRIKTAVPIELPTQLLCSLGSFCGNTATLNSGSVFFVNGSQDSPISPSEQPLPASAIGLQSVRAYYDAVPATVPKVWGTLVGPNHNDVQGQPDCAHASWPCTSGVYGYLGYPTAWLAAELLGRTDARQAFAAGGEFFAPNPGWTNQIGDITPP